MDESRRSWIFDARGNGGGGISPTITGDHQDRITDYTAIVVETMEDSNVTGADLYNFALTGGWPVQ